jgi:hypothetical protein
MVDAAFHFGRRNLFREIVVLVAIRAGEITSPGRDYMRQNGVAGGSYSIKKHPVFARTAICGKQVSPDLFPE